MVGGFAEVGGSEGKVKCGVPDSPMLRLQGHLTNLWKPSPLSEVWAAQDRAWVLAGEFEILTVVLVLAQRV